jgi:hypothetical protein
MMALSAFAAIDEARLPGESTFEQGQAILADLGQGLREATGTWSPVWVGLSKFDGANMAYLARNAATSQYAVVIRGTDFAMPLDVLEDFAVKNTKPFTVGGSTVTIAEGTANAYSLVTGAVGGSQGSTLLQELTSLVGAGGEGSTIFVTGHSLGGALATTVALYLRNALPKANYQVYTFAAPTAGVTEFATLFDSTFPGSGSGANSSWRVHNAWDVVPQAWQPDTLGAVLSWYPPPGPAQDPEVHQRIEKMVKLPGSNPYQQPTVNVCVLNDVAWATALKDPHAESPTTADFETQAGFQHDCNTYLELMSAPTVAMLAGLAPNYLRQGDSSRTVTISGLGFGQDSSVSFSNPGIAVESTVLDSQSQLTIQVSVASNAPKGPCNVIVSSGKGGTTPGGTSSFLVLGRI